MNFHILTLFPEMVEQALENSITGRAQKERLITVDAVNIRDFSEDKHRRVDDYTYGGGAGMLMQAQPVYDAWNSVRGKIRLGRQIDASDGGAQISDDIRTIYVTPQGRLFNQQMAEEFAKETDLVILCGHYEGVDERVLEETVTDYVSIGDYVLTGGELAAMVIVDAVSRLVPGVLNNENSAETESFHGNLLEYPQYSRPEEWHGKTVPKVLLSGNRKQIDQWRREQSVVRTRERRDDLYRIYQQMQECAGLLKKQKLLHADMTECIERGRAQLVFQKGVEILLYDRVADLYLHTDADGRGEGLAVFLREAPRRGGIVLHQGRAAEAVRELCGAAEETAYLQAVCTRREKLPVSGLYRADGTPMPDGLVILPVFVEDAGKAAEAAAGAEVPEELLCRIKERIARQELYGAYADGKLLGTAGVLEDGSIGMVAVFPEYRHRHVAMALETFCINRELSRGVTPYLRVPCGNAPAAALQVKLGLCLAKTPVYRWEWNG